MDLQHLIAQWSGQAPPGFRPQAVHARRPCLNVRSRDAAKASLAIKPDGTLRKQLRCLKNLDRRARSCKRRRAALVAEGGCRRCAYRKRAGRRLPLRTVPRGPRHRARAEAPGRPRRGRHRRVRRQARQGARALQPRLRNQPMERQAEARAKRRVLVAAARSRAEVRAVVAALAGRHGVAREPPLTVPPGGRGASAPVGAPRPPRRSQKPLPARSGPSRATGTVGRSRPFTACDASPTLAGGMVSAPLVLVDCRRHAAMFRASHSRTPSLPARRAPHHPRHRRSRARHGAPERGPRTFLLSH